MTLYRLIFLNILIHSLYAGSRVAVALYALQLKSSPLVIGAMMALYGALPMFLSISAGRLTDRIGSRGPMMIGSGTMIVGALLPFVSQSLLALYATSVLIGCGFMLYQVAIQHVIGFLGRPEDRPANFSIMALGYSVSAFIGPMIVGVGIDGFGHRWTFLLLSLLPVAPLLILATDRLKFPRLKLRRAEQANRGIADLLRDGPMRTVYVSSGLISIGWDLYSFVAPIYGSRIGLTATMIGVVMSSFAAATFTVRLFLPLVGRRIRPYQLITTALLLSGTTYFLFPLFTGAALLIALSFVLGLGLGCAQPMVMAMLHDTAPEGRAGEAVGVRTMLISSSQTFTPILFGAVGSAVGMIPVFWAIAAALIAGALFARKQSALR